MAQRKNNPKNVETTAAKVGYEAQLWQMADAPRGSMDAAEYKHVILGLIFLKYISHALKSSTPSAGSTAPRPSVKPTTLVFN